MTKIMKNGKSCEVKFSFGSSVDSCLIGISSISSAKTLLFLGGGTHSLLTQDSDIF